MAGILLQVACLTLLLGITSGRRSSVFDEPFLSPSLDDTTDEWFPTDVFDDFDKMLTEMRQGFPTMSSSVFEEHGDNTALIKKKLADVKPVCTTTGKPNSTTAIPSSIQNNRRKRFRETQTTTCIRQKIIDGTKYIGTEKKVTDDKGHIISDTNNYQSFSSSSMKEFSSTNAHQN